jgi:cobalamin biosynthesis Mg chelatase CobN
LESLPKANLNGGYEGVREISKRMRFTFGWSTTADAVPCR